MNCGCDLNEWHAIIATAESEDADTEDYEEVDLSQASHRPRHAKAAPPNDDVQPTAVEAQVPRAHSREQGSASPIPIMSPLPVSVHDPKLYEEDSPHNRRKLVLFISFVIAAILAFFLVYHFVIHRSDPQQPAVSSSEQPSESAQSEPSSTSQKEEVDESPYKDEPGYEEVKALYDKLEDLDREVTSCENAYKNDFTADEETRTKDSDQATELAKTLKDDLKKVNDIDEVEEDSKLYDQYQLVIECYQYLNDRMAIITKAWKTNLQYKHPEKYEDRLSKLISQNIRSGEEDVAPKVDYQKSYQRIGL